MVRVPTSGSSSRPVFPSLFAAFECVKGQNGAQKMPNRVAIAVSRVFPKGFTVVVLVDKAFSRMMYRSLNPNLLVVSGVLRFNC